MQARASPCRPLPSLPRTLVAVVPGHLDAGDHEVDLLERHVAPRPQALHDLTRPGCAALGRRHDEDVVRARLELVALGLAWAWVVGWVGAWVVEARSEGRAQGRPVDRRRRAAAATSPSPSTLSCLLRQASMRLMFSTISGEPILARVGAVSSPLATPQLGACSQAAFRRPSVS